MAVAKEAIRLSRVYSYDSKCTCPYSMCTTRYLSILFFNISTLLVCTHSVDNLLHTLMVLYENKNLSNIQSNLFLHQREVVPSSYFTFLNFEKKIRINIFITI